MFYLELMVVLCLNGGATQALTVVTLADPSRWVKRSRILLVNEWHYMHHYNMPTLLEKLVSWLSKRREIGLELSWRALRPMPSQEDFPSLFVWSARLWVQTVQLHKSFGSTLSLMVPAFLKRPVSGIAMGLMTDGKENMWFFLIFRIRSRRWYGL